MARIKKTDGVLDGWQVSWSQTHFFGSGTSQRSRVIEDYEQALTFKRLVEEQGDRYPDVALLARHELEKHAERINPSILLGIQKELKNSDLSDREKLSLIEEYLHALTNPNAFLKQTGLIYIKDEASD